MVKQATTREIKEARKCRCFLLRPRALKGFSKQTITSYVSIKLRGGNMQLNLMERKFLKITNFLVFSLTKQK